MSHAGPHLLVQAASGAYLLPARAVGEIVELPELSEPPSRAPARVGAANLRGRSHTVVDLDLALGHDAAPYTLGHRLVTLETASGPLALVVTGVEDLVDLAEADVDPAGDDAEGPVVALARLDDAVAGVLDPDPLARPPSNAGQAPEGGLFAGLDEVHRETLARRRHTLARSPDEGAHQDTRDVAVLALGEERIAVPLEAVREFVTVDRLTPVPSTPEHVLGIANHRGELVPVVDVRGALSIQGARSETETVLMVDLDEGATGVAVDAIRETVAVPDDQVGETSSPGDSSLGNVEHRDRTLTILDLHEVLTSDRITVDQEA